MLTRRPKTESKTINFEWEHVACNSVSEQLVTKKPTQNRTKAAVFLFTPERLGVRDPYRSIPTTDALLADSGAAGKKAEKSSELPAEVHEGRKIKPDLLPRPMDHSFASGMTSEGSIDALARVRP